MYFNGWLITDIGSSLYTSANMLLMELIMMGMAWPAVWLKKPLILPELDRGCDL